jgi:hypothetical protein
MRVAGVLCIVVGIALIVGLRFTGQPSARSRATWTQYNKIKLGLAGVVAIVAGILLLVGGVG